MKDLISKYRSAPRALYQKELVKSGISPESAKKYADMLEVCRSLSTFFYTPIHVVSLLT